MSKKLIKEIETITKLLQEVSTTGLPKSEGRTLIDLKYNMSVLIGSIEYELTSPQRHKNKDNNHE